MAQMSTKHSPSFVSTSGVDVSRGACGPLTAQSIPGHQSFTKRVRLDPIDGLEIATEQEARELSLQTRIVGEAWPICPDLHLQIWRLVRQHRGRKRSWSMDWRDPKRNLDILACPPGLPIVDHGQDPASGACAGVLSWS